MSQRPTPTKESEFHDQGQKMMDCIMRIVKMAKLKTTPKIEGVDLTTDMKARFKTELDDQKIIFKQLCTDMSNDVDKL